MKVSNKVSLPGVKEYEQHTAYFEITEEDVKEGVLGGCTLLEKLVLFNTIVLYQSILYQYAIGYLKKEGLKKEKELILSSISPKLREKLKEVLNGIK